MAGAALSATLFPRVEWDYPDRFRRGFDAVNRRDFDAVLEVLDPEIEWDMSHAFFDGPIYYGHAGVRRFFEDVYKLWDEWRIEIGELYQGGGHVVILGWWAARGKGSDAPVRSPGGWLWEVRDGRGIRMRFYPDPAEALKTAQMEVGRLELLPLAVDAAEPRFVTGAQR